LCGRNACLPVGVLVESEDHTAENVVRPAGHTEPQVPVPHVPQEPEGVPGRIGSDDDLVGRISGVGAGTVRLGDRVGERVQPGVDDANQIANRVRAGVAGPVLNSEGFT
jgi:hypothetical protein